MANSEVFKISAALKNLIGKELITDEFVAVFELVKNAFDANSSNVKVVFENNYDKDNASIIVIDNGNGMNYHDLKDKWLFVAYSSKKLQNGGETYRDKIKPNRVFAGAKGVGRFSCDRLGKCLNLISVKDESDRTIQNLKVNWEDFERADDQEFVNVKVIHEELKTNNYNIKHGTVLEITGLRDFWDRKKILDLKRSLVKLINPNQENDSKNFSIEIIAKDELSIDKEPNKKGEDRNHWEIVNGVIKNNIFEKLEIKTSNITVQISEDGNYIETILQDRGDLIYYLKERNIFQNLKNIKIYLFQLNRKAKYAFSSIMGMPGVEYGSVFMYKNGFRIYPYGEPGEDLLQIDQRKGQRRNSYLGNRDLIGRIEINGIQNKLVETTSRDNGLVKNESYYDLVNFFYDYALKRLERYVVNIIQWGDERINKETGEINPELWAKDVKVQILELISGFINSKNIIDIRYNKDFLEIISEKQDKSVDKIIKNINNAAEKSGNAEIIKEAAKIGKVVKELKEDNVKLSKSNVDLEVKNQEKQKKLDYIIGQNTFLKEEISNDTKNLESILHHIGLTTNFIKMDVESLVKAIDNDLEKDEIIKIVKRISTENQKITSFSKYFKKVNFNIHSNRLEQDIVSFINEYIENVYKLRNDLKNNRELLKVVFDTPHNAKFNIKINPIDLIIVIDNLINNSYKNGSRTILISWKNIKRDSITLIFGDDGNGIKENIVNHIFDFGFTTTRGSGLGLYHVKEIINKLGGEIGVNNSIDKGVEFIITFKK